MLRPFLLVGVGGSGGKTLRVVREDLERRLAQAGWTGPFPDAWQFLHIDVPTAADGNESDLPDQLPESDYQGLIGSGIDYRTVDDSLVQQTSRSSQDSLAGWRPDPERVNIPASKGAGQFRALGRTIALSQLGRIATAVREARRSLTGAQTVHQLKELTRLFGGKGRTTADDPQVIVIGSIAGGSGSGAVIDVCDVIRSLGDKWANESVGILYCPDVFDDLDEGLRRGVRPNSLAALTEIMAGYWSTEGPSTAMSELYQAFGISTGASRRTGPRYPFLVGARNEEVTHKTQNDVYRAMGRSLAAWVTSTSLQDRLSAYTQAQWASTAQAVSDKLLLHPSGTETPFTALGSARVGLGRDRFRDYASRHLARSAVALTLERHEALRRRDDERPPRHLIEEQARAAFSQFAAEAGLAEVGPHDNQILDGLQDNPAMLDAVHRAAVEIIGRVRAAQPAKGFATDDLRYTIRHEVENSNSVVSTRIAEARLARARTWVQQIQGRVLEATASAVAQHGAPVAAAMLTQLVRELVDVEAELRHEAETYHRHARDLDRLIGLEGVRNATDAEIEASVKNAVRSLEFEQEAAVRELALQLIPPLREDLLQPLIESLEHGVEGLQNEVRGGLDGRGSAISSWPEGDVVPRSLRPTPNEFLLESYETFPEILQDLLQRTVGVDRAGDARAQAERDVVLRGTVEGPQRLFTLQQEWRPQVPSMIGSSAPSRAQIVTAVRSEEILRRSEEWVTQEATAIGNYLGEGLRSYLDPAKSSPKQNAERVAAFEGQLIAALRAGAPLVRINPAVLTRVHGTSPSFSLQFSEIPLPEKSPARAALKRVLEARGLDNPSVDQAFTDGEAQFIDVFTVLTEPYEPVVFDSLMRPIMSDWGAKRGTDFDREEFWRWRRARPLPEALPLHPGTLQAMVRGWFVAGLLDQLQEKPLGIWVPASAANNGRAGYVPFEDPLLSGSGRGPESLPDVLESLSIALLRVNDEESLAPMLPYHRLLELGQGSVHALPAELEAWVDNGRRDQDETPDASTPQQRQQAASTQVEKVSKLFDQHFAALEARHDLLAYPGSFDLRHQIRTALGDLYRALGSYVPDSGSRMWA